MEDLSLVSLLPDVHELFQIYDTMYFEGKLKQATILEWSERMTRCAGICYWKSSIITIRLSRKLLQFRPFSDTINTLLHEMIHAYLFLTAPRAAYIDRDGHGPAFVELANRINNSSGSSITIYHAFSDEVRFHQQHVWRCEGRCRDWHPFYGWVRRAMNRPPQSADRWFKEHEERCGGKFVKVEGPDVVKNDAKNLGRKVGSSMLECPICFSKYDNKYKLEFHVALCISKIEHNVYIIDE
jgi:predicted SprT family Zn-dependent metalloprotease